MKNGSKGTGGLSIPSKPIWARITSPVLIAHRFSEELSALHTKFQRLLKQREDFESDLQRHYSAIILYLEGISSNLRLFSTDAPSLTLRSSPLLGLHVHIAKSKRDAAKVKAEPAFTLIAESNSTCCFFHQVRG